MELRPRRCNTRYATTSTPQRPVTQTNATVDTRSQLPLTVKDDTNTVAVSRTVGTIVTRLEDILERVVSSLGNGQELSIAFLRRASRRSSSEQDQDQVRFPGRSQQEATKFARVLLILQLSHDALVSGTTLTKRHIFYQHQDLFDKQAQVDELVDDLAFTLGVNRADLSIVAASKGVLAGPLTIHAKDGSTLDPCSGELGVPVPAAASISRVDVGNVRWILVVEKDAVFRSLCSSRYWETSASGPGVLITAKGYPDLMTRSFLNFVHTTQPHLPILALLDFDPNGVKILNCYRHGSEKLGHEADIDTPTVQWLGIKSDQVLCNQSTLGIQTANIGSQTQAILNGPSRVPLTSMMFLNKLSDNLPEDEDAFELRRELQVMLSLGIKAEIEWLDDSGDICQWLDRQLGAVLSWSL